MKCWICNAAEASTAEHRIKRTDVDLHLGPVSTEKPLFRTPADSRPKRVASSRATALKFEKTLCGPCNSDRTQPHDMAWERLSAYMKRPDMTRSQRIWLPLVFQTDVEKEAVNVHLYFLKFFGCKAVDLGLGIDLSILGNCILENRPNPNFFIGLGTTSKLEIAERSAIEVPITVCENAATGAVRIAFTNYNVGHVSVDLVYTPMIPNGPGLLGYWNASSGSLVMRLSDLRVLP